MRTRDAQRSKLYRAEREAELGGCLFKTEAEIQTYVDKLARSVWFQARWRRRHIPVRVKRSDSCVSTGGWNGIAIAPNGHMVEWVVLHEIAHVVNEYHYNHGAEFAAIFLAFVGHQIGKDAAARLREQYRVHRVKHRVSGGAIEVSRARVKTKAQEAAERRVMMMEPIRPMDRKLAVKTIRKAVAQGLYGPAGCKPRAHALATARLLAATESTLAARRAL